MANNIKGITIEIGGDTSDLQKSLSGVNKDLKTTQSELKEVEKLLKLDPKNTELLAQKQTLLNKSVSDTKDKLDVLKEAEKQVQEQFKKGDATEEQYRAIQREVIATEKALEDLEKKAKESNITLEKVGEGFKKVGDKTSEIGTKLLPVTAGIAALGAAGVAAAMELDNGYDTIITKTGASGEALKELTAVADDVFANMPTDMDKVGIAVGEINTRFGSTGDELEKLTEKFIQFSEVNGVDLNNSIGTVDKLMEQWNLDISETDNLLGLLTKKGQDTGISVDTLMNGVQENGAALKEMGLNVTQSIDLLAQFESNGVNASTAIAGLKKSVANNTKEYIAHEKALGVSVEKVLNAKDETEALKIAEEQLGITDKELVKSLRDGTTATDDFVKSQMEQYASENGLQDALSNTIDSIKGASSETEALSIAQELFGAKGAAEMTKAIREGRIDLESLTSSMDEYGNVVTETFEATLDPWDEAKIAMNNLKLAGSELGASLLEAVQPILTQVVEKVKEFTQRFKNLDGGTKELIIKIGAFVAAIGPALIIIGKVISGVGSIITVVSKIPAVLTAVRTAVMAVNAAMMANPIGLIIAAVVALIAIFVTLWNTNEDFRSFFINAWENIKEFFIAVWEAIKTAFTAVWEFLTAAIKLYIQIWMTIFKAIGDFFVSVWNGIKTVFSAVWEFFSGIFQKAVQAVKNAFSAIGTWFGAKWNDIKTAFAQVAEWFGTMFKQAWTNIQNAFSAIGNWFGARWNDIKTAFAQVAEWFGTMFKQAWTNIQNAFSNVTAFFTDLWNRIKQCFVDVGTKIGEAVGGAFKTAMNGVLSTIENIVNGFIGMINGVIGIINEIPGVNLGRINTLNLPRMAKGGILAEGSAIVAEAGPELLSMVNGKAVVTPLTGTAANKAAENIKGGKGDFYQTVNYSSPKAYTPYEVARQNRVQLRSLVIAAQGI